MAGKKVSRKKLLKEPDEFISTTGKFIQFLMNRRRQLTLYGTAALAGVAVLLGGWYYVREQQGEAQTVQHQAFQLYQEALSKSANPESEKESCQKALEKFRESLSIWRRGNTAQVSQIYVGHCHYAMKEYDQAIVAYSQVLDGPFEAMALDGLGYCYEAKGDYTKALEYFQKNMEREGSPLQETGMLGVARCYEALNQKQKALGVYQKASAKYAKSGQADFIQGKVSELKG